MDARGDPRAGGDTVVRGDETLMRSTSAMEVLGHRSAPLLACLPIASLLGSPIEKGSFSFSSEQDESVRRDERAAGSSCGCCGGDSCCAGCAWGAGGGHTEMCEVYGRCAACWSCCGLCCFPWGGDAGAAITALNVDRMGLPTCWPPCLVGDRDTGCLEGGLPGAACLAAPTLRAPTLRVLVCGEVLLAGAGSPPGKEEAGAARADRLPC